MCTFDLIKLNNNVMKLFLTELFLNLSLQNVLSGVHRLS